MSNRNKMGGNVEVGVLECFFNLCVRSEHGGMKHGELVCVCPLFLLSTDSSR